MIQIKNRDGAVLKSFDTGTLRGADLRRADLSGADLSGANLSGADLRRANLIDADLRRANLSDADLSDANLIDANLSGANLIDANLSDADLRRADLSGADLIHANLRRAYLSDADLRRANLSDADLSGADLSGATGLSTASDYLAQFTSDDHGVIVYRARNGQRSHPSHWEFRPGAFLTEVPNPCRTTECGCGVSFATLDWVRKEHGGEIWKCRIRWMDLADVVVPYNTDGKARCARLELLEKLEGNKA